MLYLKGDSGLGADPIKARDLLGASAAAGNVYAEAALGNLYLKGAAGVPADGGKAVELLKQAADAGNAEAESSLGYVALYGSPANGKQALDYFTHAVSHGASWSITAIAGIYFSGTADVPRNV